MRRIILLASCAALAACGFNGTDPDNDEQQAAAVAPRPAVHRAQAAGRVARELVLQAGHQRERVGKLAAEELGNGRGTQAREARLAFVRQEQRGRISGVNVWLCRQHERPARPQV